MVMIRYKANGEVRSLPKANADFLILSGVAVLHKVGAPKSKSNAKAPATKSTKK